MKKSIITIYVAAILYFILTSQTPQKQYTVTLTLDQWVIVQKVIDASSGNHQEVIAVQDWVFSQIKKQLADTTKKK